MSVTLTKKPVQLIAPKAPAKAVAKPSTASKPVQKAQPAQAPKEYSVGGEEIETVDDEPTPVEVIGKQAVGTASKTYKDSSVVSENTDFGPLKKFKEPHATVGLSIAVTRNLGNYESVKIHVSLFSPCANNEEAIQLTFDKVKDWVDAKVATLNAEVDGESAE